MQNDPMLDWQSLIAKLKTATRIVALTGAGVSAESGIPTFRDAQTGLWAQYDPLELATPQAFARQPQLVWDWYEWRRGLLAHAQPNAGHFALAELAKRFPHFVVVTQNIDGLHAQAGSAEVIELHGNLRRAKCSREEIIVAREDARATPTSLLACPHCGAYLRPDVVWFGEALPRAALERAVRAAMQCHVFFSIGTSGLVEPAASLPRFAREAGAFLVELNPEPTPLSANADLVVRAKSGEALPRLLRQLDSPG